MMSTLPDVHGETEATAVPRATLVQALEGLGALYRTDKLAADRDVDRSHRLDARPEGVRPDDPHDPNRRPARPGHRA